MASKSINNERGVPMDQFYAERRKAVQAKGVSSEAQRGVPMGSFVMFSECEGVTKAGNACGARPIKGRTLCAGHTKQAEASV